MHKENPWRMRFRLWWRLVLRIGALQDMIEKTASPTLVALKNLCPFLTANMITGFRVPIALYAFWCLLENRPIEALIWYILGALLDIMDGWWARTNKDITKFGMIFDPAVDKGSVLLFLVGLAWLGYLEMYLVFTMSMLEVISTSIYGHAVLKGSVIGSNGYGKAKKWFQDISVVCVFTHMLSGTYLLANHVLFAALVLSLASSWRKWVDSKSSLVNNEKRA